MALTPEEQRERAQEYKRRYRKNHPEKHRENYRRWYLKNRERILAKYKATYPEKRKYGVARANRPQPDYCEICGKGGRRLVWDHCHQRGHFRGWICYRCNLLLGCAEDDPNYLRKLIAYLERTKKASPPQLALSGL